MNVYVLRVKWKEILMNSNISSFILVTVKKQLSQLHS